MLRTIAKQNPELRRTLIDLRKAAQAHQAPVWAAVAERLVRARHQVKPVNVGHLERLAEAKATVVIPGKLLAEGRLTKSLTVAAFHSSVAARLKVHAAGGTVVTIRDLVKSHPDGSGVRLLG
ncbi:MAG TPA: 50S ribosomal protein L18e [Thermoplasmata archaeon]|nr:50S ribosomal protein L18e [Thermoplasmata archaeon]